MTHEKVDPQSAEAWSDKGSAFQDLGKYDEALKAYDKAIEIDPHYAEAWNNKGTALCSQGKHDEAIQAFDKAIELNPQFAASWSNKSAALYGQGKYGEALKACDKAIEINPQYASSWTKKGAALYGQGKFDEALKAYDKAIELNPQMAEAWGNKGAALYRQGKYDEALKAYDKAIEINPQDAETLSSKNVILEKIGNSKKPKVIDNKELLTRSESVEFDKCPACKTGRLLVTNKKKFLGIITHHDVICNNSGCNMKLSDQQVKEFMSKWEHQKNIAIDIWLTGIRRGQGFPINNNPPILLKKNEKAIFTIPNISLSENMSVRTGSYSGGRVRVAKGVSIGGGTFQSKSHEELAKLDNGTLTLTNQRIVFVGKTHSSDIPLKKIVSIEPYKNAIVVGKEGRARAQQFTGTNNSSLNIMVGGRTWAIPIYGAIIKIMIEGLTAS